MTARRLLTLPGIGVAFLPKLACPACWPAYAGLLSSVGLGFLISSRYLFGLTLLFLIATLVALGYRRRFGPLALGVAGSVGILTGKFLVESAPALYGGVALLIAASIWNARPKRKGAQSNES